MCERQAGRAATVVMWVASVMLAMQVWPVAAQSGAMGNRPLTTQVSFESKSRLLERQLAQSPGVVRIRQSQNAPAMKQLAEAERQYEAAQRSAASGQLEAAARLLDEALRRMVAASRLVPDMGQQESQLRSRNAELREAVLTFKAVYSGFLARMDGGKSSSSGLSSEDVGKIDGVVVKADAFVAQGKHQEANKLLVDAHNAVVSTLSKLLAAQTIVYDFKFNSPAEEYQHELARNHSYEELIPIALAQHNSTVQAALEAEQWVGKSRTLRETATKKAQSGEYGHAIRTMQEATDNLQRSLRIAGVFVPQSFENGK